MTEHIHGETADPKDHWNMTEHIHGETADPKDQRTDGQKKQRNSTRFQRLNQWSKRTTYVI